MYNRVITSNKKAFHDYYIEDTFEAGLVLTGAEVKSIRDGKGSIKEAYIKIEGTRAIIINMHISEYAFASSEKIDPLRERYLLLNKKEILKLKTKVERQGYTIVAIKLYFKGNYAKLEIGLAKGKHDYDKRSTMKEKEQQREIDKSIKKYKE